MAKPKVLLLGPLPPPYMGPAIATEIILHSSLKNSFRLIHLNTNAHKEFSTLGSWGVGAFLKNILFYMKMAFLIVCHRPELVLVPISQTTGGFAKDSIFILISRFFRRKTVLQLRGSNFKNWIAGASGITKSYVKFVLKLTQGIIVLGNKLVDLFVEYYPRESIYVVPNGITIAKNLVTKRHEILKLLFMSNLQPSKGIEDVLEAVVLFREQNNDIRFELEVVGSWRDSKTREHCLNMVEHARLPVRFYPASFGKDKLDILINADLFIFPPRKPEGHPWVIVEALAVGLPIISTDQGAITESVIDGFNGFIVENCNPRQIAEKIKLLAEDKELRERMGKNSRELHKQKYSEEKMVSNMANCFHRVLDQN